MAGGRKFGVLALSAAAVMVAAVGSVDSAAVRDGYAPLDSPANIKRSRAGPLANPFLPDKRLTVKSLTDEEPETRCILCGNQGCGECEKLELGTCRPIFGCSSIVRVNTGADGVQSISKQIFVINSKAQQHPQQQIIEKFGR